MKKKKILNFLFFLKNLKIRRHCVSIPIWRQLGPSDQACPPGGSRLTPAGRSGWPPLTLTPGLLHGFLLCAWTIYGFIYLFF